MNEIEIAAALSAINQQRVKPPKPGKQLQTIAKSVCRYKHKEIYVKLGFSIEDDDVDLIVDIAREAFTRGCQIERENCKKQTRKAA